MNPLNLEEFHCAICFELFGEVSNCPRILYCGHTFCNSCLENLLLQCPACPICKKDIQCSSIDDIPVNYIVKSFLSQININKRDVPTVENNEHKLFQIEQSENESNTKQENETKGLPSEGYCEDHYSYKHLRCMDCESWICGVCAALYHKPCQTFLIAEALKEMKLKISQDVGEEIEARHFYNKSLDICIKHLALRKKIKTFRSCGKDIEILQFLKSERNMLCDKLKAFETSVAESVNNYQFMKATYKLNEFLTPARTLLNYLIFSKDIHCPLSLEVLKEWCQEGSVYASHSQNGSYQYGKVEVKGHKVWVHSFKPQTPKLTNIIISFRELLISIRGSSESPRRGFFQVDDGTSTLSDVVIATDALTPRAMNFLLLCSGIKGGSYEGKRLGSFEWGIQIYFEGGGAAIQGISDGGVYEAPKEKGFVYGRWAKFTDSLSDFAISMDDEPEWKFRTKFGFVEEGFEVCERFFRSNKAVDIKHCGLVI